MSRVTETLIVAGLLVGLLVGSGEVDVIRPAQHGEVEQVEVACD